jgi:hypothetical protein
MKRRPGLVEAGIGAFAVYHLALALLMAAAPHEFYTQIGPFGPRNDHYIRDTATFNAALGLGFLAALRLPSWRIPVLAIATVQFALHTVNHLIDIDRAHPTWTGYFDFISLAFATLLLAFLLRAARADREASAVEAAHERPLAERSST